MSKDACRQICDWLSGELRDIDGNEQGVNSHLDAMPRDPGEEKPELVKKFLDTTRNDEAARGNIPMDRPLIIVSVYSPLRMDGELMGAELKRDGNVTIAIRCVTGDEDSAADNAYVWDLIRAIIRSLWEFSHDKNQEASWKRNGIAILQCTNLVAGPVRQDLKPGRVTGAVLATFDIRDVQPTYSVP